MTDSSTGKIYILMGKSSTGKDRMYRELVADTSLGLRTIVTYTTRPMREGEEDGRQYHFVNETEYESWRDSGRIIEERTYQTMAGPWRYFTADDGQIDLSDFFYIMIGTPESAASLTAYYGRDRVRSLLIDTDDGIRLERALNREKKQATPRYDEMCRRYLADREDFSEEKLSLAGIAARFENNTEPEDCLMQLKGFIRSDTGALTG